MLTPLQCSGVEKCEWGVTILPSFTLTCKCFCILEVMQFSMKKIIDFHSPSSSLSLSQFYRTLFFCKIKSSLLLQKEKIPTQPNPWYRIAEKAFWWRLVPCMWKLYVEKKRSSIAGNWRTKSSHIKISLSFLCNIESMLLLMFFFSVFHYNY